MAIQRAKTREIVVVMSGIPSNSTEWDLSCKYRDKGVSDIGSHYVIHTDGSVTPARPHGEHGNVDPRFNKHSVFVELIGESEKDITPQQQSSLNGTVQILQEWYADAEVLPLYH